LTPDEYQDLAARTDGTYADDARLLNAILGLCGESGEIADHVKKSIFHGHDLDKEHLAKEFGDILWYVAQGCRALGYTLEEVMHMNIDKLKKRYPDGFSSDASKNRVE
jgi:NTP pyrophosphatase (non-canonical NTP hydrolase)